MNANLSRTERGMDTASRGISDLPQTLNYDPTFGVHRNSVTLAWQIMNYCGAQVGGKSEDGQVSGNTLLDRCSALLQHVLRTESLYPFRKS
jgi:hypothetical protein